MYDYNFTSPSVIFSIDYYFRIFMASNETNKLWNKIIKRLFYNNL